MNQGTLMIHGHLHGNPSGLTGRIKDVGIDTNNLFPYRLDAVVNELLKIDVVRDHHDN
jgi:calcineurin-like phosphoesterase family protein